MAIKKISYNLENGKIKDIASSSINYDDANNTLTINRLSFNTMSLGMGDGLLSTSTSSLLSPLKGVGDSDILSWNSTTGKWALRNDGLDLTGVTATGDLSGTYDSAVVRNVSNVTVGTLKIQNGGTGLTNTDFASLINDSALLIGNNTNKVNLLKSSQQGDLSKKPVLAVNSNGDNWSYVTQNLLSGSVQVDVYDTPGQFIWTKPADTKMFRVFVQGAGGGGGSGANRSNGLAALGGAGGGAGAFVDSGVFRSDEISSNQTIVVGEGGFGGKFPITGAGGIAGTNGNASSFGTPGSTYISANGGPGGGGGSLGTSAISSGGASAAAATNISTFTDNKIVNASIAGSNNSTSTGVSNGYTGTTYYNAGGGASGGSLGATNFITNYNGGNGGTNINNNGLATVGLYDAKNSVSSSITSSFSNFVFSKNIFVASGGGGGASSTLTGSDLNNQPLLLLRFNESAGAAAVDTSPYSNTISNQYLIATPPTPKFGNALSSGYRTGMFYSANALYNVPNFTLKFWVNLSAYGVLVNTRITGVFAGNPCAIAANGVAVGASLGIPLNTWTHVTLTQNAGKINFYINGVLDPTARNINSTSNFGSEILCGFTNTVVGTLWRYTQWTYASPTGYLDDFILLPYAMTATEILADYQSGNPHPNAIPLQNSYPGGLGGDGAWGSGGGGGGASTNVTGSLVDTKQGGNGGNGYVAVISYKDF